MQVIPHVTDEIKAAFRKIAVDVDVVIIEIGGTVGDIESLPFLEAVRQMRLELGAENSVLVHVTLVPFIPTAGELKTKPTQHSVKELLSIGIQPDILLCRSDRYCAAGLEKENRAVLQHAGIARDFHAGHGHDLRRARGAGRRRARRSDSAICCISRRSERDMSAWLELLDRIRNPQGEVRIAVVGKYVQLEDAYKSLREALIHGGLAHKQRTVIEWVEAEEIDSPETAAQRLQHADGILIPGGFGKRGIQGMIYAIEYARTHKVPFFGICLGMQCATIEYARNVVGPGRRGQHRV